MPDRGGRRVGLSLAISTSVPLPLTLMPLISISIRRLEPTGSRTSRSSLIRLSACGAENHEPAFILPRAWRVVVAPRVDGCLECRRGVLRVRRLPRDRRSAAVGRTKTCTIERSGSFWPLFSLAGAKGTPFESIRVATQPPRPRAIPSGDESRWPIRCRPPSPGDRRDRRSGLPQHRCQTGGSSR